MLQEGETAEVVFVADDLAAWLVGLLADAGRKRLTRLVLGSDQERALQRAATAAVEFTATELDPSGGDQAGQLAMVVSEVFREPTTDAPLAWQATLLEALQAGIAERLSVLDDATLTGTGQSSAEVLGVPSGLLAETLARHLVRVIMLGGSGGGPLAPLADQLNHDVTHLQGQRLEGMLARLAGQVTTLAGTGSTTVASQPVRLLPGPAFLVGREELLADLDARLTGAGADGPRVVALCGLGGAGKTSVALEYAHRHLAGLKVAWQFPAEDAAVLAAGFAELAAQLGARGMADTRDPVASVHAVLARFAAPWLLIFDNAADMASVAAFLPPAGPGRVLITSQNPNWPPGQAMEVPVLGTEVAGQFLLDRTGDLDRQAARDLAGMLGGLPLALEQAAAYMRATGRPIAEYLALFRERRTDLLARGEPAGYERRVTTTWALAFEQLQHTAPEAIGLLRLLACCAPEAVPLDLLLQPRPGLQETFGSQVRPMLVPLMEDPLAADDAVTALRRYSLISPPLERLVSVHRLVQTVTLGHLSTELATAWRQAAGSLIEAALPSVTEQPTAWSVYAMLVPHAQAALTADSGGMAKVASYLGQIGNYAEARALQQQVLEARKRVLGGEHPDTLTARANLARWTGEAGDAAGARDQYAALLPIRQRVSGPGHPRTLTVRANLAHWTGEAGEEVGARDQYAALLPTCERVLGAQHPDTLAVRANLARWTGRAGEEAAARDQYAALLPVIEQVLGPEHPATLDIRGSIAAWTGRAGDAAGARGRDAALLPVAERVLGAQHPDTLAIRGSLARWTGEAGDAAGARDQYAALLPMAERALGPRHPKTLTIRGNLASWIGRAGNAPRARDQEAALLPVVEQVLGPEHPHTVATRAHLASWAGEAGDESAARDQYAVLLPVVERVFGAEHPETLLVRANLARWTGEAGDAAGARDQYSALLPVEERVFGAEHPSTLTCRGNLAYWTGKTGDAAGARDRYAALLPAREWVSGPEHPETLIVRANIAYWTGEAGDKEPGLN